MRRTTAVAALALAGLLGPASLAQAAPARVDVPTCLIANGAQYTKATTCVELVADGSGDMGTGRYGAAPGSGAHTVTVTVEYRLPGAFWVRLASATDRGQGELSADTRPVRAPRSGVPRACVSVDARPALCTA